MSSGIIVDSSPLILLLKSGHAHFLPAMFDSVIAPDAVWNEILAGHEDDIARRLLPDLQWLTRRPVSKNNDEIGSHDLGRGETEVLTLALSLGETRVLIDDSAARRCAKALEVPFIGTGGLLILAKRNRLIESFSRSLDKVRSAGLWISPEIEKILMQLADE